MAIFHSYVSSPEGSSIPKFPGEPPTPGPQGTSRGWQPWALRPAPRSRTCECAEPTSGWSADQLSVQWRHCQGYVLSNSMTWCILDRDILYIYITYVYIDYICIIYANSEVFLHIGIP